MAVGATVEESEGFYSFLSIRHVQRQYQPPRSVVAANFEDGVGRRRLLSRISGILYFAGFLFRLFAGVVRFRMYQRVMSEIAFVAMYRRRTRLGQVTMLQALEA